MPLLPRHRAQVEAFRAQRSGRGAVHELRIARAERLTNDAAMLEFELPEELHEAYRFQAGQHVVILHQHEGEEIRRSYSICVPPSSGRLCVGIKRVEGGRFSGYAVERLRAGDTLRVMTPTGHFTPRLNPRDEKTYAAIAVGSGITPLLSIVVTILDGEPQSRVVLFYGNRTVSSTMFGDELERLEARYGGRLTVHRALSREPTPDERLRGRIGYRMIAALLGGALDEIDDWFLCGPDLMTQELTESLIERGVREDAIHRELFAASARGALDPHDLPEVESAVTVTFAGRADELKLNSRGPTILAAALAARPDVPYACRDGVCGTCRAKVTSGEVVMESCSALDRREIAAGYVLACRAHPVTDEVTLDFDG